MHFPNSRKFSQLSRNLTISCLIVSITPTQILGGSVSCGGGQLWLNVEINCKLDRDYFSMIVLEALEGISSVLSIVREKSSAEGVKEDFCHLLAAAHDVNVTWMKRMRNSENVENVSHGVMEWGWGAFIFFLYLCNNCNNCNNCNCSYIVVANVKVTLMQLHNVWTVHTKYGFFCIFNIYDSHCRKFRKCGKCLRWYHGVGCEERLCSYYILVIIVTYVRVVTKCSYMCDANA